MLGPNGGGKTTLFRALLGELRGGRGHGARSTARPRYVPQTERSRLDFPVSALDVALMGAYARTLVVPADRRRATARSRAPRSSASASPTRAGERFGALSGGQRQRVLIARALVQDARRAAARRAVRRRRPDERGGDHGHPRRAARARAACC